jgi:hypothetical protein
MEYFAFRKSSKRSINTPKYLVASKAVFVEQFSSGCGVFEIDPQVLLYQYDTNFSQGVGTIGLLEFAASLVDSTQLELVVTGNM